MGFSVPLADWLRDEIKELAEDCLFNREAGLVSYFKTETIRKMWQQHQDKIIDYSAPLWSMLMFQMWWDRYMITESIAE